MVKDHRTKYEVGDVDKVLDGGLNEFMRAYLAARRSGNITVSADSDDL